MKDTILLNNEYRPQIMQDYCVVDIETTGLSRVKNEIIEISALKVRSGVVVDEFSQLVKPSGRVGRFITGLTGITNDMLSDAPNIKDVLPKFLDFVGEDEILGHNVHFDIGFIRVNCERYLDRDFSNSYVDTRQIARRVANAPNNRLSTLAKYYNIDATGHHRALCDCEITYKLYKKLIEKFQV